MRKLNVVLLLLIIVVSIGLVTLDGMSSYQRNGGLVFLSQIPKADKGRKIVYLAGAVARPGIYEVGDDMRLAELVESAGGFTSEVDANKLNKALNLAKILEDEEHVLVEGNRSENPEEIGGSANSYQINLNTANLAQLLNLPGVGESTAQKIIDNRPYSNVEDLLEVPGIGEAKFQQIKSLVFVE